MNNENLIPNSERTPNELREITRKGGIASGKSRRERKTIVECLRSILDEKVSTDSNITKREAIVASVVKRLYEDGDVKDLKTLTDICGESIIKIETNQPMLVVPEALAEKMKNE